MQLSKSEVTKVVSLARNGDISTKCIGSLKYKNDKHIWYGQKCKYLDSRKVIKCHQNSFINSRRPVRFYFNVLLSTQM